MTPAEDDPCAMPVTRNAAAADVERLVAFNCAMARETEARELEVAVVRQGVCAVLADPGRGFYVVAEIGAAVVGALMVTFEWSDWRNGNFLWIQSVYVRPEFRGRGVYRRLYDHVRADARARGDVCGFRLYVEAGNEPAQHVYAALGMRDSGYLVFEEEVERGE